MGLRRWRCVVMIDLFPAFSLAAVAFLNLMARLDPPPIVRGIVVAGLMLALILYLFGRLHLYLPSTIGVPLYIAVTAGALAIIIWNWLDKRKSGPI